MPHLVNDQSCDNNITKSIKMEPIHRDKLLITIFILITCIKILLFPTYHSTDFEVHRNWLAITESLPINEWYTNEKSQWTLDYPPLFAWFEYILSKVAFYFDPQMLKVDNLNYASNSTKYFQRASVVFTDLVFVYGVREIGETFCNSNQSFIMLTLLSLCNIGLLIIDHVHFQYNGFLLGVLLISLAKVSRISKENQILQGAFWFAILLNLKHIYLYVAPAYGVWLLRSYCLQNNKFIYRVIKLGIIVIFVLYMSFGPFIHQIPQVLSRLFPFKRGLVHAYWAANAWAVYAGADKLLSVIWKKAGWLSNVKIASMTGGLVQEDNFTVLPTPTPLFTFIITFLLMLPVLCSLFFNEKSYNNPKKFVRCVILCGLTSFMFGWHVHEKAVLTAIIPLCILATTEAKDARIFLLLSSAGHTALFPLLYPIELTPLKLILWFAYLSATVLLVKNQFDSNLLKSHEWIYVSFLPVVTIYETVVHKIIFGDRLPFLPLALTSIFCALGVTYSYIIYYYTYMTGDKSLNKELKRKENEEYTMYKLKKRL
ncbi:probable dolichyl pyrophosphate Glc1Man9GlcNAc2 alpha-1,3-glucosyltransferase [Nasonia vitripennis]|uniref:Alpha-1,3-glucosyltransferase n=1 Tax=Nasonia vitripennis TaxID=7425 RepID=A0A7M7QC05_NASVI|nr:probable dolichyl pyrophosphate Glc1Man9GlcNAc2 alpha-1,3-glucosyltransferase [Nasonia vitripennis]